MNDVATKAGYMVFPLAGSAYGPSGALIRGEKAFLTHAYNRETDTVLCGKVKSMSILDDLCMAESVPSCPYCLKKWNKM